MSTSGPAGAGLPITLREPDPNDHSPDAEFRRDILDICRELGIDLTGQGGATVAEPDPATPPDDEGGPARTTPATPATPRTLRPGEPDGTLEVRAGTPFRMVQGTRALGRALAWQKRRGEGGAGRAGGVGGVGGGGLERDLLLFAVGRAGTARLPWLGRVLDLHRSSVAELVGRAERDGLVEGARDPADRRVRLVRLTAAGRAAAARSAAGWRALDDRLLKGLTAGERDELRRLLRKVARTLAGVGARL